MLVGPKKVGLNKKSDEILVTSKNLVTLDRLKFFEKFSHFRSINLVLFKDINISKTRQKLLF